MADTEFLRRIYFKKKYSLVFCKKKTVCKKAYAYLTGLSLSNKAKYDLFKKEKLMLNDQIMKKYYSKLMHSEIMYSYYSEILNIVGATIYAKQFKEAKIMLEKNKKDILKYTNKRIIIKYYETMILFRNENVIPKKIKDAIYNIIRSF